MILCAQQFIEMLLLSRRCIADEERCVCSQAVSMLGGQLASQEGGGSCGVAMTSRNQSVSSSRPGLQAGRCSRQTSNSRREQRSSVSMRLLALALVLIVGQSEGASLRSNVLELEDDHESLLTRAKDLFTDAVHDAANAVKPAAKRWSNQKVRMLRITEAQAPSGGSILALVVPLKGLSCDDEQACFTATPQYLAIGLQMVFLHTTIPLWQSMLLETDLFLVQQISLHASKKPAAGGVPSWFTGASLERKTHSGQLQGNRRMLRRQKAHHHSVEDEWLKCHRRCLLPASSNSAPFRGRVAVLGKRSVLC